MQSGELQQSAAGEHALDGEFGPVAEGVAVFIQGLLQPSLCWNSSFAGRGIYIVQSLQGGKGQEKDVGASRLTSQTCSFYAGVNAAVGG